MPDNLWIAIARALFNPAAPQHSEAILCLVLLCIMLIAPCCMFLLALLANRRTANRKSAWRYENTYRLPGIVTRVTYRPAPRARRFR